MLRALLLQAILFVLSYLSLQLSSATSSLLLYIPLFLGIVFVHWFGPQVLPVLLINGVTTLLLWGVTKFDLRMSLISTHEAVVGFTSWFLYHKFRDTMEQRYFTNTKAFLRFTLLAILIPVSVNSVYVYHYGFIAGNLDKVAIVWLSDFITILPGSVTLLYFFRCTQEDRLFPLKAFRIKLPQRAFVELAVTCVFFVVLSLLIPFDKYWFIYGIGATLFALRWGFEAAIVLNVCIFMLTYVLPLFDFASSLLITQSSTEFTSVHLGMSTMMFVSLLVGRVVSDLSTAEANLIREKSRVEEINNELQHTNEELDRFVYSVSHDLSAPLKSIKGLIMISRMEPHLAQQYIDKIDKSVDRLEAFIGEVLDYSRTNRKQLTLEEIKLRPFIEDINKKFEFMENSGKINFLYNLSPGEVISDSFLLKVAMSNLISNAIKYQKKYDTHTPMISISSSVRNDRLDIEIADNGEGIREEYQGKLFNMFYRGTASSSGSGLGLYIAKEAIQKLHGKITFTSRLGEGSTFRISIPHIKK